MNSLQLSGTAQPAPCTWQRHGAFRAGAAAPAQRRCQLRVHAGKGFDSSSSLAKKKTPKLARLLADEESSLAAAAAQEQQQDDDWVLVPDVDAETSFLSKPIKPVIFATGKAICLYKPPTSGATPAAIYCSDASSTAFQYPLADAKLLLVKGKPAVEVPLDGTVYDLASGKVITWCPKDTLGRKILGTLKDRTQPVDLKVWPVKVQGSKVFVKLTTPVA